MPNYAETLDHNAAMRKGRGSKPILAHIRIEEAENEGHSVEHQFESGSGMMYHEPKTFVFGKYDGEKPQLPEGHVLHHIAKHLGIPHEVIGKTKGAQSQEPEKEADEVGGDAG